MREYVNMCENTLNLGLDFVIQKLREVFVFFFFTQISIVMGSILSPEVQLAAFLMHVLWHIQI